MVTKTYVSINSLSSIDRGKLKKAISELNDSMTRVSAENDLQKDTLASICEELGLDKKLVRRMAKVYFKANFNNEVEENKAFEEFYTIVMNTTATSEGE